MKPTTPQQIKEMADEQNDLENRLKAAHRRNLRQAAEQTKIELGIESEAEKC